MDIGTLARTIGHCIFLNFVSSAASFLLFFYHVLHLSYLLCHVLHHSYSFIYHVLHLSYLFFITCCIILIYFLSRAASFFYILQVAFVS